jgi:3-(3-hydroxy-phenyl)propionate hydroxylase
MTDHTVVVAGGGPTGLMLAGELALAGVDVAIVERRASQEVSGRRAGGLHSRTIEILDQRGIADRFISEGKKHPVVSFHQIRLDISDFPTRHNYLLALWQSHFERILAGWVGELAVPIYREREVTGFTQDDFGVNVDLSDGLSLRAEYLVGCDGGRSQIRKAAGIEFLGWDPTTSWLIAEVESSGRGEFGMETGPGSQGDLAREPPCHLSRRTAPGRCSGVTQYDGASRASPDRRPFKGLERLRLAIPQDGRAAETIGCRDVGPRYSL